LYSSAGSDQRYKWRWRGRGGYITHCQGHRSGADLKMWFWSREGRLKTQISAGL